MVGHVLTQRIVTTTDGNGNSRALWMIYAKDGTAVAVKEYYNRPPEAEGLPMLPTIAVTPAEFHRLLRSFPLSARAHSENREV